MSGHLLTSLDGLDDFEGDIAPLAEELDIVVAGDCESRVVRREGVVRDRPMEEVVDFGRGHNE